MDPFDSDNLLINGKSPVNWVTEICTKEGTCPIFDARDTRTDLSAEPNFEMKCCVNNYRGKCLSATQFGRSKKEAKHRVSIMILNSMGLSKANLCGIANSNSKVRAALTSTDGAAPQPVVQSTAATTGDHSTSIDLSQNHIGNLIEFCAKHSLDNPIFELVRSSGPPHMPSFTMACRIGIRGLQNPYVVEITKCSNQKIIKNILAAEMLDKLRGDVINLRAKILKGDKFLEKEEKQVLEQLETVWPGLMGSKSTACSMRQCGTLFSHIHHELQQMTGPVVSQVKELVRNEKLLESTSVDLLNNLRDEQKSLGHTARLLYFFDKHNTGGTVCYIHFKYRVSEVAVSGEGTTDEFAKMNAAKAMLELLTELSHV